MKKIIIIICISLAGCSKSDPTTPQPPASIKLEADNQLLSYSETNFFNSNTFIGINFLENKISATRSVYTINGGNGKNDYFLLQFIVSDSLQTGDVTLLEDGAAHTLVTLKKNDSLYGSPLSGAGVFKLHVNSYSDKILNATFSGVLKTGYGTPITITNGQFINLPKNN